MLRKNGVGGGRQWKFALLYTFDRGLGIFVNINFFKRFLLVLLSSPARNPVDYIGDREVPSNKLQVVLDGTFTKQALEDASDEVRHYCMVPLL